MRVVDLKTFHTLPSGTLFEMVRPNHTPDGDVQIKGTSYPEFNDWDEMSPFDMLCLETEDNQALIDTWLKLLSDHTRTVPHSGGVWCRKGFYPQPSDGLSFLIYEEEDLRTVISIFIGVWLATKYPLLGRPWRMNGYSALADHILSTSKEEKPTIVYQQLMHDDWTDVSKEVYDREYRNNSVCTRIIFVLAEGKHDIDLSLFQ